MNHTRLVDLALKGLEQEREELIKMQSPQEAPTNHLKIYRKTEAFEVKKSRKGRHRLSAAGRAAIVAAAKRRWAEAKGGKTKRTS